MTDRLQRILNAASRLVIASSTGVYHLCCTTISAGLTFQNVSTTSWTLYCASLLAGESSEVLGQLLHTSFGSRWPSTTARSQSTTPYSATALLAEHVRAPSGLFGRRS